MSEESDRRDQEYENKIPCHMCTKVTERTPDNCKGCPSWRENL